MVEIAKKYDIMYPLLIRVCLIKDFDRLSHPKGQGYTDGRVKCRKPVEEPGTVPRVRIGNFRCLID